MRFCIRLIDGASELLAIMDIRARSISFASRPRRPDGPPDHERAGETFLHLLFLNSQTSAGKLTLACHLPYLSRADPCPRRQIQAQIFCFAASGAPGSTRACKLPTSKTGCAPSTKKKDARKNAMTPATSKQRRRTRLGIRLRTPDDSFGEVVTQRLDFVNLIFAPSHFRCSPNSGHIAALARCRDGKTALDDRVLRAMAKVPRHEFVPFEVKPYGYLNRLQIACFSGDASRRHRR